MSDSLNKEEIIELRKDGPDYVKVHELRHKAETQDKQDIKTRDSKRK